MAYKIDFTEANHVNRSRRKFILRGMLVAALAGAAWTVYDAYMTYNQPTLNMKLAEYEAVTRPIEEINGMWDDVAKAYNANLHYFRLLWATNPVKFLEAMTSDGVPRFRQGFKPLQWSLKTGGECQLDYLYVFHKGDKAEQTKTIETDFMNAVTSAVEVVDGKVDVQGIRHENLLDVTELSLKVKFNIPGTRAFFEKPKKLNECVKEIAAMRKRIQETKIVEQDGDAKSTATTARQIMMAYLPIGKDKPGFPAFTNAINIAGWFSDADSFIMKHAIPDIDQKRNELKATWDKIGNARLPWDRFKKLDNSSLIDHMKALEADSDGVKKFKDILHKRKEGCSKKLEPLIAAYSHNDVFNKPLIKSDLEDRAAGALGISPVRVTFKDENGAEPVVLVKEDERFVFTWVRWTLTMGGGEKDDALDVRAESSSTAGPLVLEKVTKCAKRIINLGPGYALDSVKIVFDGDGNVSAAVLEGLLPVKKVESLKEAEKDGR